MSIEHFQERIIAACGSGCVIYTRSNISLFSWANQKFLKWVRAQKKMTKKYFKKGATNQKVCIALQTSRMSLCIDF